MYYLGGGKWRHACSSIKKHHYRIDYSTGDLEKGNNLRPPLFSSDLLLIFPQEKLPPNLSSREKQTKVKDSGVPVMNPFTVSRSKSNLLSNI